MDRPAPVGGHGAKRHGDHQPAAGGPLETMGHTVMSVDGNAVGGYQAIMFTPDSNVPPASGDRAPIRGVYRAGSDHRKDGQAVGF